MAHPQTLPTLVGVFCNYCYINTGMFSCNVGYPVKDTNIWLGQNAICAGGPVLPIPTPNFTFHGPYPFCGNISSPLNGKSKCFPHEITLKTFNASCYDPIGRPHSYKCEATSQHWVFYPPQPDFSSHSAAMAYVTMCLITCLLTVSLNTLNIYIIYKSRQLYASKTMIFGSHMAGLDLLVGLLCLPLYVTLVYSRNQYFYKGDRVLSDKTFRLLNEWFNRLDLLILMASFTNLALMSLERFIVVYKPFWHMKRITMKKIALSVPAVWLYTSIMCLLYYYVLNKVWFSFLTGFVIPTTVMMVSYNLIICTIKKSTRVNGNDDESMASEQRRKTEHKVTLNLLVLVAVFLVCWIPYFALLLHYNRRYDNEESTYFEDISAISLFRWIKLLSYCHCFLDPILYSLSRPNVRVEVTRIVKGEKAFSKTSFATRSTFRQTQKHCSTYNKTSGY